MDTKISIVFSFIAIAAAVLLFSAGPLVATHQAFAYGHGGYGPSMAPCGGGPCSIVNGQIICTQMNG
jgi:hypothetical protein